MKWLGTAVLALILIATLYMQAVTNTPGGTAPTANAKGPVLQARVVRIASIPLRWHTHQVIVIASTPDGRTGHGVIARERLIDRDCEVGSPVNAHMEGAVLVVDALTCGDWK